ncbi:sensor histidine kinase [Prosthecobacter sp.]|uniref:sensor histidine kinase n=1 Tax=Prosthecobacter sp. TaxID=1965333 RepID=UPI0024876312|nr:sensor histidine kinase [Prosthecobacter sp.]MDI1312514.1 sensor histidine kinase [Prosthecobacter sp.]
MENDAVKTSAITDPYELGMETGLSRLWARATNAMRSQSVWVTLGVMMLCTLGIGWLDYITGFEVTWFVFYGVPIFLAVWWAENRAGLFIAVLSGVVWWLANMSTTPYETQLGYTWALANRLVYLCVVVFAVTALRNKQESDAARIQMLEERRQLEKDIVSVSEHEQQRIGQDLHDGICQQLAAIGCAARVLAEDLQAQGIQAAHDASLIEGSLRMVVMEARNLARGIFPVHVDRSGLAAALEDLGKMMSSLTGIPIVVNDCVDVPLDAPEISMHLYRIAQEAVANAVKHSGATEIHVAMKLADEMLELRVEDNGKGMRPTPRSTRGDGMGLRTMHYRAQALHAVLTIEPRPHGGTLVSCRMNLKDLQQLKHHHDHEEK